MAEAVDPDFQEPDRVSRRSSEGEEHDSFCYYTMLAIMVVPPALAAAYTVCCQLIKMFMYTCVGVVMVTIVLLLLPVLLPLSVPLIGLALLSKFLGYTHSFMSSEPNYPTSNSAATSPRSRHRRHKLRNVDFNSNSHNGACNGYGHSNGYTNGIDGEHVFLNGSGVIHTNGISRNTRH